MNFLLYNYFATLDAKALAKLCHSLLGLHFVFRNFHLPTDRFEAVPAIFRQFLNDITEFRTALVAGAGRLALASAAGSLRVFASAAHDAVLLVLMLSF